MTHLLALLLGLIQGLTEFFPISSSAHLKLTKMLFGVQHVSHNFDLACHLGTLLALLFYFRADIGNLFTKERTKLFYLSVALVPLIPFYFFLEPIRAYASNPQFLGLFLMLTGALLLFGKKIRVKKKKGLMRDVLLIGTMQSAALIPGISRSASTISTAQILGWNSKESVRFSFLLAIPTILGGTFLESFKMWKKGGLERLVNLECVLGFFGAFFAGMLIIRFAVAWLEKGNLSLFGWYCLTIGLLANIYLFMHR